MSTSNNTIYGTNYDNIPAPRHANKWTVNECLSLNREFELLKLTMPEIALRHGRTVNAIMFKIQAEGWASYNDLYVQTYGAYTEENDLALKSGVENDVSDSESDASLDDEDVNDDDSDEEFVPNVLSDSEDEEEYNDGSNYEFIFQRIRSMQKQINTLMGYFSKGGNALATAAASESVTTSL
jgi:hypothetical protein